MDTWTAGKWNSDHKWNCMLLNIKSESAGRNMYHVSFLGVRLTVFPSSTCSPYMALSLRTLLAKSISVCLQRYNLRSHAVTRGRGLTRKRKINVLICRSGGSEVLQSAVCSTLHCRSSYGRGYRTLNCSEEADNVKQLNYREGEINIQHLQYHTNHSR